MARYIDADNFRKTMTKRFGCIPCLTDYSEASRNDIPIDDALNLVPTADVVPKSEVERLEKKIQRLTISMNAYGLGMVRLKEQNYELAREIFAEIDRMCIDTFGNFNHRVLAELKKKYTEGEPNVSK